MLTPEQRAQLRALIEARPSLAAMLKDGRDGDLSTGLHERLPDVVIDVRVPRDTFTAWATSSGLWTACHAVTLTAEAPVNLKAAALTVLDLKHPILLWVDMRLPIIQQLAGAFQQAGLMGEAQVAEMIGLGKRPGSLVESVLGEDATLPAHEIASLR